MTDRLSEEEAEEVAKLFGGTIVPEVIRIADKFNYDRDSLMKYVANLFSTMAEFASFENYGKERGMTLRTKGEQRAYADGFEMGVECVKQYLPAEDKKKADCFVSAVRNAVEIEDIKATEN